MENKKIILGSIFIILSGVLYEVERILSYFKWAVEVFPVLNRGSGEFNSRPDRVDLSNNLFVLLFLIIGLCFFVTAFLPVLRKNDK